jgi:hypothetical protein
MKQLAQSALNPCEGAGQTIIFALFKINLNKNWFGILQN